MKIQLTLLLALLVTLTGSSTKAQTPDPAGVDSAPPGSTVITSDELRVDEQTHTAVFSGNVLATGTNFSMKCQEMTVNFGKDGKVDTIAASGDVVIQQPGRVTHSGQAEYVREEDKFVLTDQPTILDNKNQISAPKITIYRTKQSMYTEGRTRTTLQQGIGPGDASVPPTTDQK